MPEAETGLNRPMVLRAKQPVFSFFFIDSTILCPFFSSHFSTLPLHHHRWGLQQLLRGGFPGLESTRVGAGPPRRRGRPQHWVAHFAGMWCKSTPARTYKRRVGFCLDLRALSRGPCQSPGRTGSFEMHGCRSGEPVRAKYRLNSRRTFDFFAK